MIGLQNDIRNERFGLHSHGDSTRRIACGDADTVDLSMVGRAQEMSAI